MGARINHPRTVVDRTLHHDVEPAHPAALVDVGLRFLTRRMAEDAHDAPRTVAWTRALRRIVRRVPTSLAEPMLEAIVHHRATDTDAIRLALAVALTGILASRSGDTIRKNAVLLPAYTLLLGLIALL